LRGAKIFGPISGEAVRRTPRVGRAEIMDVSISCAFADTPSARRFPLPGCMSTAGGTAGRSLIVEEQSPWLNC
jgi:hypothetical protein